MGARPPHILDLGDTLPLALVGLSHCQLVHVYCTCKEFRNAVKDVWSATKRTGVKDLGVSSLCLSPMNWTDRAMHLMERNDPAERRLQVMLRTLRNLLDLSLAGLRGLSTETAEAIAHLPQLQRLNVSSTTISNDGVHGLSGLSATLAEVDLTYCPLVSYASVLRLRDTCPKLRMIRRQPSWLDGHYETPWGEVHTYYPCGAFLFECPHRPTAEIGWVAQYRLRGTPAAPYVEDRLLLCDDEPTSDVCGQSGVLLMPHESGHVIVVEDTRHPAPPTSLPHLLTRWQRADGPDKYALPDAGSSISLNGLMVSSMRVRPLAEADAEPPAHLQARLREWCDRRVAIDGVEQLWRKRGELAALVSIERASVHGYASTIGSAQHDLSCHFGDEEKVARIAKALWARMSAE